MKEQKVWFKNAKGQKISGLLFTPKKPIASVIICIGLIEVKEDLKEDAIYFAKKGFKTLVFDYINCGESSGNLKDFTLTTSINSLRAAIDFLGENVFIFAESYGGKVALHTAARDKRIRAIHLLSPLTYRKTWRAGSWREIAKSGPISSPFNPEFTLTKEFAKDLLSYDLNKDVKKIKCPVSMTHGDIDKEVLVDGTKKLYSSLKIEKRIHIFKGVGHDEELTEESWESSKEMAVEWFKKYLK